MICVLVEYSFQEEKWFKEWTNQSMKSLTAVIEDNPGKVVNKTEQFWMYG